MNGRSRVAVMASEDCCTVEGVLLSAPTCLLEGTFSQGVCHLQLLSACLTEQLIKPFGLATRARRPCKSRRFACSEGRERGAEATSLLRAHHNITISRFAYIINAPIREALGVDLV